MIDQFLMWVIRRASYFVGLGTFLAFTLLLPDVELWRRALASFVLSITIVVSIAGREYDE